MAIDQPTWGVAWDDVLVPAFSTYRKGTGNDPDWETFVGNIKGFAFDGAGAMEELFFQAQIPHSWLEGQSDVGLHVHWSPADANAGNVRWSCEYSIQSINGGAFPAPSTIHTVDATSTTALYHEVSAFAALNFSGHTISAEIVGRLYRDSVHADDTYASDAFMHHLDFHILKSTPGSRTEWVK